MSTTIAFLDCETVHLTPGPATIWELALILRDKGQRGDDRELAWHIRPDLTGADPGALKVGGYYGRCLARRLAVGDGKLVRDTSDALDLGKHPSNVSARDIAGEVADLLAGAVIVGANVGSFDIQHLDAYLRAHGECLAADYHYLDTGSLALGYSLGSGQAPAWPMKHDATLISAGLNPDDYTAHQALDDARAVRDLWDVLTEASA